MWLAPFFACVCLSWCKVCACHTGVWAVPVFPVLGQCHSSHLGGRRISSRYEVGAFRPGDRSVRLVLSARSVSVVPVCGQFLLSRLWGRCLSSRYKVKAFCAGHEVGAFSLVFIPVSGLCLSSHLGSALFPRCLSQYMVSDILEVLGWRCSSVFVTV